jgi:hypothetical protein
MKGREGRMIVGALTRALPVPTEAATRGEVAAAVMTVIAQGIHEVVDAQVQSVAARMMTDQGDRTTVVALVKGPLVPMEVETHRAHPALTEVEILGVLLAPTELETQRKVVVVMMTMELSFLAVQDPNRQVHAR